MEQVHKTLPALAERVSAANRISYDVLTPIRILRRTLGLASNDLTVLTALISFLPKDGSMTVVFPSNEVLSTRSNGLDERTLRRCLGRLVAAGLIQRKSSANGKRFPLKSGGTIRDAFGFDLSPLRNQRETLFAKAERVRVEEADVRSVRAQAAALRAHLAKRPELTEEDHYHLAGIAKLLRRKKASSESFEEAMTWMKGWASKIDPVTTKAPTISESMPVNPPAELTGMNGHNVRHTDSSKKYSSKADVDETKAQNTSSADHPPTLEWEDCPNMASFFPKPQSTEALQRTICDVGRLLHISQEKTLGILRRVGPIRLLLSFEYLLSKAETILNPARYIDKLVGPYAQPTVS